MPTNKTFIDREIKETWGSQDASLIFLMLVLSHREAVVPYFQTYSMNSAQ